MFINIYESNYEANARENRFVLKEKLYKGWTTPSNLLTYIKKWFFLNPQTPPVAPLFNWYFSYNISENHLTGCFVI